MCEAREEKRRHCEQRVKAVEGTSIVPLVLSTVGGIRHSSTVTFKRNAALLAEKTGQSYAATINVVRCRLSFALLYLAVHVRLIQMFPISARPSRTFLR